MLRKSICLTALIILFQLPAQAKNNIFNVISNKSFPATYVVDDGINASDQLREFAISDLKLAKGRCDLNETPKFVDLVVNDSRYGPGFGKRTFYVNVIYSCS